MGIYDNYPYYNPFQRQQAQPAEQGLIWVQGDAGAKGYLVAPGTTVPLFDSEEQVIHIKSADMSGLPHIRKLHYTIEDDGDLPASALAGYVKRDELAVISSQIEALNKRLDAITEVHHE